MNKPRRARSLSELAGATLGEAFAKQGFASRELVTRWSDIAGAEIAAHAEPIKMQWPRNGGAEGQEPATLVLRVEGPVSVEIQHLSNVIIERVNRFFGWQAVGRIALRQAPLQRRKPKPAPRSVDAEATARIAATLPQIENDDLRQALARLGAAIKRT